MIFAVISLWPCSDQTMVLQWQYCGLTVIRLGPYGNWIIVLQWTDYDFTVISLRAYSYQIMTLQWSEYGLTVIRPWPYSDHTAGLQLSEHDLTVIIQRAYNYQTMTLQWSYNGLTVIRPWPYKPGSESCQRYSPSLSQVLRPSLEPIIQQAPSTPPPLKCPVRKGDHSPLHRADVKNMWSYTSTSPYSYLVLCVIKYMNNLVFIRIRCVIKVQKWDINP